MTREEALNIFKSGYIFEYSRVNADGIRQIDGAVNVAIKDLEQEPCEDCISRQDAIEFILEFINNEYSTIAERELIDAIVEGLQKMPCKRG